MIVAHKYTYGGNNGYGGPRGYSGFGGYGGFLDWLPSTDFSKNVAPFAPTDVAPSASAPEVPAAPSTPWYQSVGDAFSSIGRGVGVLAEPVLKFAGKSGSAPASAGYIPPAPRVSSGISPITMIGIAALGFALLQMRKRR